MDFLTDWAHYIQPESITAFILSVIGSLFLLFVGVAYWLPPIVDDLVKRQPPRILTWAYSILTVWSLVQGILIINSKPLINILHAYTQSIFLQGLAEQHFIPLLISVFLSLTFLLANLVRSYFNLHRIEEAAQSDSFSSFIKGLKRWPRAFECSLRFVMFISILMIDSKLLALDEILSLPTSISENANDFSIILTSMWRSAIVFYVALLIWDWYLWWNLVRENTQLGELERDEIKIIIKKQALTVHICGIAIALLLTFSDFIRGFTNELLVLAFAASIVGVFFLSVSMKEDIRFLKNTLSIIRESFRSITHRTPKTIVAEARADAEED